MNFSTIFFIILLLVGLTIGQSYYESDVPVENATSILTWDQTNFINQTDSRPTNIIRALVNAAGIISFEFVKWGVEFGYEHPEINYKDLLEFARYLLIVSVVVALLVASPYVLGALYAVYLIIKVFVEWMRKRKRG